MEKKEMTGFQGIFFDEINKKKLIDLQERKLKYVVKDMHITFKFGKTEKYPEEVFLLLLDIFIISILISATYF